MVQITDAPRMLRSNKERRVRVRKPFASALNFNCKCALGRTVRDPNCNGKNQGRYEPSTISSEELEAAKAKVVIVWLSSGNSKGKMSMSSGNVTGIDMRNGNLLTDASTVPGSSGGIVFAVDPKTKRLVFQGLNVGAYSERFVFDASDTQKEANEFLNVDKLIDQQNYASRVDSDLKKNPVANPLENFMKATK